MMKSTVNLLQYFQENETENHTKFVLNKERVHFSRLANRMTEGYLPI